MTTAPLRGPSSDLSRSDQLKQIRQEREAFPVALVWNEDSLFRKRMMLWIVIGVIDHQVHTFGVLDEG